METGRKKMQRESSNIWKRFQRTHPDAADRIRELILPACEVLRDKEPDEQMKLMEADAHCAELLELLREHSDELRIIDDPLSYVAFSIKLCYCELFRVENKRSA